MSGQPHQRRLQLHQGPLRDHVSQSVNLTVTFHSDYSICQKVPAPDGGVRLPAVEDVARVAPPRDSHAEDDVRRRELVKNSSGHFKLEEEVISP